MIRFILLQNRAGKTRLAKYYVPLEDGEKRNLEYDVHRLIAARDAKFTNFVEVRATDSLQPDDTIYEPNIEALVYQNTVILSSSSLLSFTAS